MDRRSFVKGAVGVAGVGALGAAGVAGGLTVVRPREAEAWSPWYYGAHLLGGPAPNGTPYVPLVVRDGAFFADFSAFEHRGERFAPSQWHAYCGAGELPAGEPLPLVYWREPEVLAHLRPWYADRLGEPVRPDDFPDVGFGASAVAGSVETPALRVTVVRWTPDAFRRVESPLMASRDPFPEHVEAVREDELAMLRERVFSEGFVAAGSACTHFCCTAGFKEAEALARPRDAWDRLFCTCHNVVYELREPVRYRREPLG
jgi:hypothetical protein